MLLFKPTKEEFKELNKLADQLYLLDSEDENSKFHKSLEIAGKIEGLKLKRSYLNKTTATKLKWSKLQAEEFICFYVFLSQRNNLCDFLSYNFLVSYFDFITNRDSYIINPNKPICFQDGNDVSAFLYLIFYHGSGIIDQALMNTQSDQKLHELIYSILDQYSNFSEFQNAEIEDLLLKRIPNTQMTQLINRATNNIIHSSSPEKYELFSGDGRTYYDTKSGYFSVTKYDRNNETYNKFIISNLPRFIDSSKSFIKVWTLFLHHIHLNGYAREINIPFQDFVDWGIYSTLSSAKRALSNSAEGMANFFEALKMISIETGSGNDKVTAGHSIITGYEFKYRGRVTIYFNRNEITPEIFGNYTALLPTNNLNLSNSAFALNLAIVSFIRSNIKKKLTTYKMNIKNVFDYMGLPTPEEVRLNKKRDYKRFIYKPIIDAIEEINNTSDAFYITLLDQEYSDITSWINNGKLAVTLKEGYKNAVLINNQTE